MTDTRIHVLFLCTGNSCRSQMAEGWVNHLHPETILAVSAGIETHGLNSRAVQVMGESGVDISGHQSQHLSDFDLESIDLVISVCGHADASCPTLPPGVQRHHHPFPDPPKLATDARNEEEALLHFKDVRDQIRDFARALPALLARLHVQR